MEAVPRRTTTDTDAEINKAIGARIRAARQRRHMTQVQLSVMLDVQSETVSRYESGTMPVSLAMLTRIAQALDADVGDLLGAAPATGMTKTEIELLDVWRRLDRTVHRPLLDLMRALAGRR